MAEIVLGLCTSHGPMLHIPPEHWEQRVISDKKSSELCYQGRNYGYEELLRLRSPGFEAQLSLPFQQEMQLRAHRAIEKLAAHFKAARVDLAIIFGNDQRELFLESNNPSLAVYYGSEILNAPASKEQQAMQPPGIAMAEHGHCPPEPTIYPGAPSFGEHLVRSMMEEEFDVATMTNLPQGSAWRNGIPHAFGFVYRQIMRDRPPPSIPIIQNVFFPPNQPTSARSLKLGHAVVRAIKSWSGNERIALIGSGGLSHFVVDESLDSTVIGAMRDKDETRLAALAVNELQSGCGEIKNWFPVAAAMNDIGMSLEMIDYVPFYRSNAGTGSGMGFAVWQ